MYSPTDAFIKTILPITLNIVIFYTKFTGEFWDKIRVVRPWTIGVLKEQYFLSIADPQNNSIWKISAHRFSEGIGASPKSPTAFCKELITLHSLWSNPFPRSTELTIGWTWLNPELALSYRLLLQWSILEFFRQGEKVYQIFIDMSLQ